MYRIYLLVVIVTVSAFLDFDLKDALPGHVTDDQTTTEKPVVVERTEDISDQDLLLALAENKKSRPSKASDGREFLKVIQGKLDVISFDKIHEKLLSHLKTNYEKAKTSIYQWIKVAGDVQKITDCFENVDISFKTIIQAAHSDYVEKGIKYATVTKTYNDKLYSTLSAMRQCILSKLRK